MRDVPPPRVLAVCAGSLSLQALALLGVGVFLLVELVRASTTSVAAAAFTGVCALLGGGMLGLAARALLHERRWARSPAALVQLLLLPVAYGMVQSDERTLLGAVLLVWGMATLVLLLSPSLSRALQR